jgi:hypothetical protein
MVWPCSYPARGTGEIDWTVESRNAANDGKLSSHGNLGFAYPASLRKPDAPGFECRPLYYTGEQHIGCLVEVTSQHLILDGFGRHRRHLQGIGCARHPCVAAPMQRPRRAQCSANVDERLLPKPCVGAACSARSVAIVSGARLNIRATPSWRRIGSRTSGDRAARTHLEQRDFYGLRSACALTSCWSVARMIRIRQCAFRESQSTIL